MTTVQKSTDTNLNQSFQSAETSEMEGKYLSFWTEQQLFGVPIADVVQIVGIQQITELPETPHYVKGIINLRGSVIPIIDVRLRLNKPEKEYDERTCIIVTTINEAIMGFIVDAVDEVTSIEPNEISPPPQINAEYAASFLTGIAKQDEKIILLISTKQLLGEKDIELLSNNIMGESIV